MTRLIGAGNRAAGTLPDMSTREGRAVRYDRYGGVDELYVTGVGFDDPGPGRVLVEVHAAGINPGETALREGVFAESWPSTFPSGQGSDWADFFMAATSTFARDRAEAVHCLMNLPSLLPVSPYSVSCPVAGVCM